MNTSVKAELGSLLLGILCRSFALALPPDQWGYACLLLVTGAACGASIAAYIGKALGLADTGGTIFGKILLNISVVVIFGPAARPLPQLPITVDDEGYLVARSGFTEPVGPSFWERH